jgi:hypothetical protein
MVNAIYFTPKNFRGNSAHQILLRNFLTLFELFRDKKKKLFILPQILFATHKNFFFESSFFHNFSLFKEKEKL